VHFVTFAARQLGGAQPDVLAVLLVGEFDQQAVVVQILRILAQAGEELILQALLIQSAQQAGSTS
jgi:hypothetical protein